MSSRHVQITLPLEVAELEVADRKQYSKVKLIESWKSIFATFLYFRNPQIWGDNFYIVEKPMHTFSITVNRSNFAIPNGFTSKLQNISQKCNYRLRCDLGKNLYVKVTWHRNNFKSPQTRGINLSNKPRRKALRPRVPPQCVRLISWYTYVNTHQLMIALPVLHRLC